MCSNLLANQASCPHDTSDRFIKGRARPLVSHQLVIGGYIVRQRIVPGGLPFHLSSLLRMSQVSFFYYVSTRPELRGDVSILLMTEPDCDCCSAVPRTARAC